MTENTSGLEPLGRAVLVRKIELEDLKATLIKIPDNVRQNAAMLEQRAEVVAIGPECWKDEQQPRCAVGDRVIVTKLSGYQVVGPEDGKLYCMVNANEVFCKIKAKENSDG